MSRSVSSPVIKTSGSFDRVGRAVKTPLVLSLAADAGVAAFMMMATTFVVPAATWQLALEQLASVSPWMSVCAPTTEALVRSRQTLDVGIYATVMLLVAYPLYRQIVRTLCSAGKKMEDRGLFSCSFNRRIAALGACGSVACVMMLAGSMLVGFGFDSHNGAADVAGRILMMLAVLVPPSSVLLCFLKWLLLDAMSWDVMLFEKANSILGSREKQSFKLYLTEIAVCAASFALLLVAIGVLLIGLVCLLFELASYALKLLGRLILFALTAGVVVLGLLFVVYVVLPLLAGAASLLFGSLFG